MAASSSVARWLLNENNTGQTPTVAFDNQGSNDLAISFDGTNSEWTSVVAGSGWEVTADPETASCIAKLDDLANNGNLGSSFNGVTEASLLFVCNGLSGTSNGDRVIFAGTSAGNGELAVIQTANKMQFRWGNEVDGGIYEYDETTGVTVVAVVFDSTQADDVDKVKVYFNNVLRSYNAILTPIVLNEPVNLNFSSYSMCLMNRPDLILRGAKGALYYVEMFNGQLSTQEISDATTALLADNDANWASATTSTVTVAGITNGESLTGLDYAVFAGQDLASMTILKQGNSESTDTNGDLEINLDGTGVVHDDPLIIIISEWTTTPIVTDNAAVCYANAVVV